MPVKRKGYLELHFHQLYESEAANENVPGNYERDSKALRYECKRCKTKFCCTSAYLHRQLVEATRDEDKCQPPLPRVSSQLDDVAAPEEGGNGGAARPAQDAEEGVLSPGGSDRGHHDCDEHLSDGLSESFVDGSNDSDLDSDEVLGMGGELEYSSAPSQDDDLDEVQYLDDWLADLDQIEDGSDLPMLGSSVRGQANSAAEWRSVAGLTVSDAPAVQLTVRQAAFNHLEDVYHGVAIHVVEQHLRDGVAMFGGHSHPNNPQNRYPPSLTICRTILGVHSLDGYEENVCPNGCRHVFPHMSRAAWQEHAQLQLCSRNCPLCRCKYCKAWRFSKLANGKLEASAKCYHLRDAFQMLFWDPTWVRWMLLGQQSSRYTSSPEGQRVRSALSGLGYDLLKVRNCALDQSCTQYPQCSEGYMYT